MSLVSMARIAGLVGVVSLLVACSAATPAPTLTPPATSDLGATATPEPTAAAAVRPTQITQPTATMTPKPTPETVALPPTIGVTGGSLTIAGLADIPHRDVHQAVQETLTSLGPGLAYSRLLRLSTGPDQALPSLVLECDLCLSWEMTSDLGFEFHLRPGVHWQDIAPVNGRLLLADDLVFSYERLRTTGWPNAPLLSAVESMEAPDAQTLRLTLSSPDADLLLSLADGHAKVVAPEVVSEFGDLKTSPVIGTGPWIWERTQEGIGTTLSRNPTYFEEGVPFLDQLFISVIKEDGLEQSAQQKALAAFSAGVVEVATLPPGKWGELQSSGLKFGTLDSGQAGTGVILTLNVRSPIFHDLNVRRAIFKAIDPWDYVDNYWSGQGYVSVGIPVESADWLLGRSEIRPQNFADPSEARRFLTASGLSLPVDIELAVRTERFEGAYLNLAGRLAEDLQAVGFNPTIRGLNPARFGEVVVNENKDYQLALGVVPPTSTTNSFLFALLHSAGRWNLAEHQDNVLDAMIERQAVELDPVRRRDQIREIQRYVLDQAYLFSPITGSTRWVFDPDLRGFHPNTAISEYIYWSRTWLDR
ncbi:MAG: hypothetical protein BZY88_08410 [SAR202 cluster bacterium Io17-Chloro-G9]|nr:MAG: hypothetical protein BZY88_08410 [SAR202 cluster bacterium Io17-Chloro-G9]